MYITFKQRHATCFSVIIQVSRLNWKKDRKKDRKSDAIIILRSRRRAHTGSDNGKHKLISKATQTFYKEKEKSNHAAQKEFMLSSHRSNFLFFSNAHAYAYVYILWLHFIILRGLQRRMKKGENE